jgi:hypothetical protein
MNTSELLHTIARDRISGMHTISKYQLKPTLLKVRSPEISIDLNNDMWILNTMSLHTSIGSIEIISSDNIFITTREEYALMDEYRFQVFTDYMDIKTTTSSFSPYVLEFVKIIPHRD